MKTTPIVIEALYNAPADRVWKALTEPAEMKNWYFDITDFAAKPGFQFQFSAGPSYHQYIHLCEVKEVIKKEKISYTWSYNGYPGESLVTFHLYDHGQTTGMKLVHDGLESFPQDDTNFSKGSFIAGWTEIIGENLKSYVEENGERAV